jgi:hypothetical protein
MAKTPLEKDTQKKILQWLQHNRIFAWSNKTQGTFDPKRGAFRRTNQLKGVPDILGILPDGRFLGIEVKRHPNKPSLEQIEFLDKAHALGALSFIAYDLEDVMETFAYQVFLTKKR